MNGNMLFNWSFPVVLVLVSSSSSSFSSFCCRCCWLVVLVGVSNAQTSEDLMFTLIYVYLFVFRASVKDCRNACVILWDFSQVQKREAELVQLRQALQEAENRNNLQLDSLQKRKLLVKMDMFMYVSGFGP